MKKMLFFLMLIGMLTSCLNDYLEVEPLNDISTEVYWKSEKDVRAALNAAYAHLQNAYKVGYLAWTEARSDNFLGNSAGAYPTQNLCFNRLESSLPQCDWNHWYKMVSSANYAIYFIPTMNGMMAESKQNHLLSEAYFLRAFAYFSLYRIWGDVPLITEPVLKKSEVIKPFKQSKEKVMELIKADLAKACQLVDNTQTEIFLYSPGALYALCTDVAMWNKDYDAAIDYSQKLIDLNRYSVEGVSFKQVCSNAQTKDNIWTLKWSFSSNGANNIVGTYYNSASPYIPTKVIYEKWQQWEGWSGTYDVRRQSTIDSSRVLSYLNNHVNRMPTVSRIWKWSPSVAEIPENLREAYIPMYRYADILLLRAEALNHKGHFAEAIGEMNKIRRRAGLKEKTLDYYTNMGNSGNITELIEDDLLQERQFELFAEGKRWFDLMRTGRAMSVMNAHYQGYITNYGGKNFRLFTEEWQLYWPVHQNILNENGNLTQLGSY